MKNKTPIIISFLLFSIYFLVNPIIEFKSNNIEISSKILVSIVWFLIFIRLVNKAEFKKVRVVSKLTIWIFFAINMLILITNFGKNTSRNTYYTIKQNSNNEFNQLRETSGSIYDYRTRIIYYENYILTLGYTKY